MVSIEQNLCKVRYICNHQNEFSFSSHISHQSRCMHDQKDHSDKRPKNLSFGFLHKITNSAMHFYNVQERSLLRFHAKFFLHKPIYKSKLPFPLNLIFSHDTTSLLKWKLLLYVFYVSCKISTCIALPILILKTKLEKPSQQ